jgi:hypothetical protein
VSYPHREWTTNVPSKENVEEDLELTTSLTGINALLAEVKGTIFMFSAEYMSTTKYFLWDCLMESYWLITYPSTWEDIINQIKKDITKVKAIEYNV